VSLRSAQWVSAALLIAGVASFGGGCSPSFDPYSRLETLRVLAIRSDPVSPASGETANLSALIYTVPGQPVTATTWSWCPLAGASTAGYPCLVTEADLSALTGQPVSFDLGSAPTASLTNAFDPTALQTICAGTPPFSPPPDCTNGLPVTIRLTVTTADDQVVAIAPLNLLFGAGQQANNNPTIGGPFAVVGGVSQDLDAAGTPILPRLVETPIGVTVPDDASETYLGTDNNGNPASVREQLVLTWFVESGDTQDQNTTFIDGVIPLAEATTNGWTPDSEARYPVDTAELIVVIRDGRNGVAWTSGLAHLAQTP
jgi:hypothetical protein